MHSNYQVTLTSTAQLQHLIIFLPVLLLINAGAPVIMYHLLGTLIISLNIQTGKSNSETILLNP